jgi:hypothetical protein
VTSQGAAGEINLAAQLQAARDNGQRLAASGVKAKAPLVPSQSVIGEKGGLGRAVVLPVRDAGRSILPANYFLRPAFYVVTVSIQAAWARWLTAPTSTAIQISSIPRRPDGKPATDSFEHRLDEPGAIPLKTLKVDYLH